MTDRRWHPPATRAAIILGATYTLIPEPSAISPPNINDLVHAAAHAIPAQFGAAVCSVVRSAQSRFRGQAA